MGIKRKARPATSFYILDKSISEDKALSWQARGMLVFLLGKPDNWIVSVSALVNETKDSGKKTGRDGVYAIIAELEKVGYIKKAQNRIQSGEFSSFEYMVHESPAPLTDSPLTGQPETAQPDTANPTQVSIEELPSIEEPPRIEKPMSSCDDVSDIFEFWKQTMGKRASAKLTAKRRGKIQARLKDGFTVEQIKNAIVGCSKTPWNIGENPTRTRYDDIELICRDESNVERFESHSKNQLAPKARPVHHGLGNATGEGLSADVSGGFTL